VVTRGGDRVAGARLQSGWSLAFQIAGSGTHCRVTPTEDNLSISQRTERPLGVAGAGCPVLGLDD
jgi:hypothetical protein